MKNTKYLNLAYYLHKYLGKSTPPPRNPLTKQPITPEALAPLFPKALIEQEMSMDQYIDIPEPVMDAYALFRPSPLIRAKRLEQTLKTPAKIFFKYEGVSPVGSHKTNTALAQAYYNKQEGVKKLITETGAGQWGSALALSCHFFDLECFVYMVKISYEQKPYRKTIMKLYGANVVPSPSTQTRAGRMFLKKYPGTTGSLGMAISEAIEDALQDEHTKYSLGSVLNHVLLHQTIIGLETKEQFKDLNQSPDIIIGCCGGGSNLAGLAFPYIADKLQGKNENIRVVAVEPSACASLTTGDYRYDYGDSAHMTPELKMHTLGSDFVPEPIHAGGLRYHGVAPMLSLLKDEGLIEARSYEQKEVFKSAQVFMQTQGIIPAPESSHAIKATIDEAVRAREENKEKTIVFNLSGHGFLDLGAYEKFLNNELE